MFMVFTIDIAALVLCIASAWQSSLLGENKHKFISGSSKLHFMACLMLAAWLLYTTLSNSMGVLYEEQSSLTQSILTFAFSVFLNFYGRSLKVDLGRSTEIENELATRLLSIQEELSTKQDKLKDLSTDLVSQQTNYKQNEASLKSNITNIKSQIEKEREFIASLNYAIRTRMNSVLGMTDMLSETKLSNIQKKYMSVMRASAADLVSFINNIYDYTLLQTKSVTLRKEAVNLQNIVQDVCSILRLDIQSENVQIVQNFDSRLPMGVKADGGKLRQILLNLIQNAVKFTVKGDIHVSLNVTEMSGGTAKIKFEVKDSGPGIPASIAPHIFEPIKVDRLNLSQNTTGGSLGLPLSQKLAELMGGKITAHSPGSGAVFAFELAFEITNDVPLAETTAGESDQKRILIVAEDKSEQEYVGLLLKKAGHKAEFCSTASDVAIFLDVGKKTDLIISFELEGYTAIRDELKRPDAANQLNKIPLLIISDFQKSELGKKGLAFTEYTDVFTKPIDKSEILRKVDSMIKGKTVIGKQEETGEKKLKSDFANQLPLKILIVEDNDVNMMLVTSIVEKLGYKADTAVNGKEAVDLVKKNGYDVIFMDVIMPEMDGLEATKKIRRSPFAGKRSKIIAMTANAMEGDKEECLAAGMDDYISKPIRIEKIRDLISKWGNPQEKDDQPSDGVDKLQANS